MMGIMSKDKRNTHRPLTTGEAADFLGVSVETMYILARDGLLRPFIPGRQAWRWDVDELEAHKARKAYVPPKKP